METTDLNLFVRTSEETISDWDRSRIVDALMRETMIDQDTAVSISKGVEELIVKSGMKTVTSPLVRELVNAKLIEQGLEAGPGHTRLGMPLYDVENLMVHPNKENANVPHGPEATNLTLAERIKKEYALLEVFSPDVADGHMKGDIHLHDLGFIDRPYCSGQSLEYIKKFGLESAPFPLHGKAGQASRGAHRPSHQIRGGPAEQLCGRHRLGCRERLLCSLSLGDA